MTNIHKYILQKGSTKYLCPNPDCRKKTFVRYIDLEKKTLLPEKYGRCDREIKCSYHLNPYRDGYENINKTISIKNEIKQETKVNMAPVAEASYIPIEVLKETLKPKDYEQNFFVQNLLSRVPFPFQVKDIEKVISQYYLGSVSSGFRAGAITFPFIDMNGHIRTIQVKEFDKKNHTTGTDFLHSMIENQSKRNGLEVPKWVVAYQLNALKVSCLFGEHLLHKYTLNPIALVEAPKTAIYATLYFGFPDNPENLLWLAVYNLSSLNFEKCKALKNRNVYLFPDLSKDGKAFELWSKKAEELTHKLPGTYFKVSELLENLAQDSERLNGADIADILIKLNWRTFRSQEFQKQPSMKENPKFQIFKSENSENSEACKKNYLSYDQQEQHFYETESGLTGYKKKVPLDWTFEINDLELFFRTSVIPSSPIQLNQCSMITDVPKFIKSHLSIVTANNGKPIYLPYLERLKDLKKYLVLINITN